MLFGFSNLFPLTEILIHYLFDSSVVRFFLIFLHLAPTFPFTFFPYAAALALSDVISSIIFVTSKLQAIMN